jgi:nucleoside 2-deoxyribosyltransferase
MKFYVAGKFEEAPEIAYIQDQLEAMGHTVTFDWVGEHNSLSTLGNLMADIKGVQDADVVIGRFVNPLAYAGSYTEMGMALAWGKPVWIYGHFNNSVFRSHPLVKLFSNEYDLLKHLRGVPC